MDRPLIIATHNEGKISEFKGLLSGFPMEIKGLRDMGPIPSIVEDGTTFEQNAYKKAHRIAKMIGFPTLADDSGLMVEVLGGQPGVRSARYAGERVTDEDNNRKLLEAMKGKIHRRAVFQCVISIALPSGPALTYEGSCEGEIAQYPQGKNGFGYDPIFYYPPLKKTFAQLTPEEKNRISHRGRAMAELREEFQKVLIWLKQRLSEECFDM